MVRQKLVAFLAALLFHSVAFSAQISRVSVSSTGEQGRHSSFIPASISADGRYVAFSSNSSNLVERDSSTGSDIFVHDRNTGITEIVNISTAGVQGNNNSSNPSISDDGRYVVFESFANQLVENDRNGTADIFIHDRVSGHTELVSLSSNGEQANSYSDLPSISGDGRFVAYRSFASNLVEDDTNQNYDLFVHDRITGVTKRISVSSMGVQSNNTRYGELSIGRPSISSDGRYIVFESSVSYLVEGDTNQTKDIFIHDITDASTKRVNLSPAARQANGNSGDASISADGQFVVFSSYAWNLVQGDTVGTSDIFIRNLDTGVTEIVSNALAGNKANARSARPSVSTNGRFVTFESMASNLVVDDSNSVADIYMYDRQTGNTERLNVSASGEQANSYSGAPSVSNDGRFVVFGSSATNLIENDTNNRLDIFVANNSLARSFDDLSVTLRSTSEATTVGEYVRFRAEFNNNSDSELTNCTARIVNPLINFQREFSFFSWPLKTANPKLNGVINIASGETGHIQLAVLPRVTMRKEVKFEYSCDSANAVSIPFENTLHLVAKTHPLLAEDFVRVKNANKKTVVEIDRTKNKYWTPYVINISNSGLDSASVNLIATTDIPIKLLGLPQLCEPVNPVNRDWSCIVPRSNQIQVDLMAGEVKKVLVFLHAKQSIEQRSTSNRIFIEARDQSGEIVAKNSIGVYTIN